MTEQLDIQHVTQQLNQQKARLQQMLLTLEQELEAIKTRNGERLVEISKFKEQQLAEVRAADSAINNEQAIELINNTPQLTAIKQSIIELLEQCQQKNEVCYLTASQNQIAVEQVKNLLVGGSRSSTYNELGQKSSYGSLGKGIKA